MGIQRCVGYVFVLGMSVAAGCGQRSTLPPPVERLPGKWHGEMIVYEETQTKLPSEKVAELAKMQMDFEFHPDGSMALMGVHDGKAYTAQGRWQPIRQEGDVLIIKSIEQSGTEKDIQIEFDGSDTFYIPLQGRPSPDAEVAELGAMRFSRLR
jgi:hypothetical protein